MSHWRTDDADLWLIVACVLGALAIFGMLIA